MSAELLLAVPPTIDLCRKYIGEGRQLCRALKHASSEVSERLVRLENNWVRFNSQLNFFQRIEGMMEEEHREVYHQTLQILQNKLESVVSLLRKLIKSQPRIDGGVATITHKVNRWKYAGKKHGLDQAMGDLELWQGLADQSWFLLLRIADSRVDEALITRGDDAVSDTSTTLPASTRIRAGLRHGDAIHQEISATGHYALSSSALRDMAVQAIPFCDGIELATRTYSDGTVGKYILNHMDCTIAAKPQLLKRNVRDLVHKLQVDDPHTFGLLKCKGFIAQSVPIGHIRQLSLTLIFRNPPGLHSPRSLRDLLINMPTTTSTTQRLDMARDMARSIGYVHIFGFVHKNVRPESMLIFSRVAEQGFSTFLVGFEEFRRDEGWTQRRGDDAIDRNLYRHPSRQGFNPRDDYEMRHDIYSLGVCLLEIGLWSSFVKCETGAGPRRLSNLLTALSDKSDVSMPTHLPEQAKSSFVALARHRLPGSMGDEYAEVVETCLTCLDPGNADFGDETEFEDDDGIRVGARYIEKILLRLGTLRM